MQPHRPTDSDIAGIAGLFDATLGAGYVPPDAVRSMVALGRVAALTRDFEVVGAVTWVPAEAVTDELAGFDATALGRSPVGVLKSLAVCPSVRGRGLGGVLLDHAEQQLRAAGAASVASVSWVSGSTQSSEPLFRRSGWTLAQSVPDLWRQDSLEQGYTCPTCGHPCRCTGLLFVK